MKLVSGVVAFAIVVPLVGSGLGALPYGMSNEGPCFESEMIYGGDEVSLLDTRQSHTLAPYGTRCEFVLTHGRTIVELHRPSTPAFAGWLALTGLMLGVAVWARRSAAVRGAGLAILVLGIPACTHRRSTRRRTPSDGPDARR